MTERRVWGWKPSLALTLVALCVAYIGWAALRGAMEARALNAAFADRAAVVAGAISSHDLVSSSDSRRTSVCRPIVDYEVDRVSYTITAATGVKLEQALGAFKEGTRIDVQYLPERPDQARVWHSAFCEGACSPAPDGPRPGPVRGDAPARGAPSKA